VRSRLGPRRRSLLCLARRPPRVRKPPAVQMPVRHDLGRSSKVGGGSNVQAPEIWAGSCLGEGEFFSESALKESWGAEGKQRQGWEREGRKVEREKGHMRHFVSQLFWAFESLKCLHCGTEGVVSP
jgi:hypothetical protein